MKDNELPDPEAFAKMLGEMGVDPTKAALNEGVELALKVVEAAEKIKLYAISKGFSFDMAEGMAADFWTRTMFGAE